MSIWLAPQDYSTEGVFRPPAIFGYLQYIKFSSDCQVKCFLHLEAHLLATQSAARGTVLSVSVWGAARQRNFIISAVGGYLLCGVGAPYSTTRILPETFPAFDTRPDFLCPELCPMRLRMGRPAFNSRTFLILTFPLG